ncbi:MAG: hypothetical protein GY737_27760 [Desulfobacteraceae bacterium]|nr:hypothetical protein [Desulfobacteraceae bacterium]
MAPLVNRLVTDHENGLIVVVIVTDHVIAFEVGLQLASIVPEIKHAVWAGYKSVGAINDIITTYTSGQIEILIISEEAFAQKFRYNSLIPNADKIISFRHKFQTSPRPARVFLLRILTDDNQIVPIHLHLDPI